MNPYPLSENCDFPGTEHPIDLRPACKLKFINYGQIVKTEHSVYPSLIVAVGRSLRTPFSKWQN